MILGWRRVCVVAGVAIAAATARTVAFERASEPLAGRLRIEGTAFRDDRGPVLPLYAHAGDLFSLFVRDPSRAAEELDAVARAGYHGVRVWAVLGCHPTRACPEMDDRRERPFWFGREVGPGLTPDYYTQVDRFFAALTARRLRAVWSLGDVGLITDRRDFMSRMAGLDARHQVIDWIDCGNEAWQTGEPDPARLAECVGYYAAAGGRALKTLTAAPSEELVDIDRYSIAPADAFNTHSWRNGHSWDKRRHIASLTRGDRANPRLPLGINSEPPGGGALVSAIANGDELDDEAVALLAVASLTARQAFVWFSGEGVQIHQGLAAAPGYGSVPRAVALLPADVMRFERRHHSGETSRDFRVLEAAGDVRIDGALDADGRFAYTIDGPPGSYSLRVARPFEARLCHPATGVCETVAREAGQVLDVSFVRGRILVGRATD